MKKLLVICGLTATGKTALGIKLAKKFQGEVVSADSRQVYKGMSIGTGKDIPQNSKFQIPNSKLKFKIQNYELGYRLFDKIPVWLVDVCQPDQEFSVAHFVRFAKVVIEDIWKRKKLPIVVGGTGFWIKALLEGVGSIGIGPDWEWREKLRNLEIEKLREKLRRLNPERLKRMNQSDRNNPRRLIRAIEIALKYQISNIPGLAFGLPRAGKYQKDKSKIKYKDLLMIGLRTRDYKTLYKRIDKRVDKRVNQGVEEEVGGLLKKGYTFDLPSFSATGYRVWKDYFEGKKTLDEIVQHWKYDEHGLARRQLTFFKKLKKIKWFNIEDHNHVEKIENLVERWYSRN